MAKEKTSSAADGGFEIFVFRSELICFLLFQNIQIPASLFYVSMNLRAAAVMISPPPRRDLAIHLNRFTLAFKQDLRVSNSLWRPCEVQRIKINLPSITDVLRWKLLCSDFLPVKVTVPGEVVDVACGVDHTVALVKSLLWALSGFRALSTVPVAHFVPHVDRLHQMRSWRQEGRERSSGRASRWEKQGPGISYLLQRTRLSWRTSFWFFGASGLCVLPAVKTVMTGCIHIQPETASGCINKNMFLSVSQPWLSRHSDDCSSVPTCESAISWSRETSKTCRSNRTEVKKHTLFDLPRFRQKITVV